MQYRKPVPPLLLCAPSSLPASSPSSSSTSSHSASWSAGTDHLLVVPLLFRLFLVVPLPLLFSSSSSPSLPSPSSLFVKASSGRRSSSAASAASSRVPLFFLCREFCRDSAVLKRNFCRCSAAVDRRRYKKARQKLSPQILKLPPTRSAADMQTHVVRPTLRNRRASTQAGLQGQCEELREA